MGPIPTESKTTANHFLDHLGTSQVNKESLFGGQRNVMFVNWKLSVQKCPLWGICMGKRKRAVFA
jgi:hypothetical protein